MVIVAPARVIILVLVDPSTDSVARLVDSVGLP